MRAESHLPKSAPSARPATGAPAHDGGGRVGQLHDLIELRLGSAPIGPAEVPLGERIVQAISRSAGWVLLGGCYLAAAAALFG